MAVNGLPRLAGKVILVTGASRGLGWTIASGLCRAGASVSLASRSGSAPQLRRLCEDLAATGGKALATVGDVTSAEDCERMVAETLERFGRLDVLVNNAALGMSLLGPHVRRTIPFQDVPVDAWKAMVDTNVNGTFLMARAAVRHMLAHGWGRIVNLSTSLTTMVRPGFSPYGPSKAAIDVMTAIWAKELADTGITVNSLLPGGPCDTDMVPAEDFPDRAALIRPSAMVEPALWLAGEWSDGITGMRITAKDWTFPVGPADVPTAAMSPAAW